jgi:hypothetical protein
LRLLFASGKKRLKTRFDTIQRRLNYE